MWIRVGREAVAENLSQDLCAACLRGLKLFEDQYASAFSDHEAVAILVKGAAGVLGVVVARRERSHRGEPSHTQWRDGGFGAACDHRVGITALNDAKGVADRVCRGGAGRRRRLIRSPRAVLDRDVAGGEVDDRAWDEERRDLAWAAAEQIRVLRSMTSKPPMPEPMCTPT